MPKDNRRRIKEEILEEIEECKGGNFTEKLLNWKNNQDEVSIDYDWIGGKIEKETDKVVERLTK